MAVQDQASEAALTADELRSVWPILSRDERAESLLLVDRADAEDFFFGLTARDQADVILELPPNQRRSWMRLLAPDDAADVLQQISPQLREETLALLDEATRREAQALLAYAEDDAGGLMNPRFARVRPELSADEAISYLRKQTRDRAESVSYVYVLDEHQKLLGVVSFRDLLTAGAGKSVRDIMQTDVVSALEDMDQEAVSRLFAEHDLVAIPVVDGAGCMKGIVTIDDIVDVVQEEATEDMQKAGGSAALGAPYLEVGVLGMIRKRAGWLAALFMGEMLTATAMGHFEAEIARAVVLALFIPLIISSGGNSGSQASTLVIRAMALGEVRLRDWWRVVRTEILSGFGLGAILGAIGFTRIMVWQGLFHAYGPHYALVALTVAISLVGVVMWGTIAGSMLPFLLRRLGFDPASASAPFVATLVDVSGLIIYFSVASIILADALR